MRARQEFYLHKWCFNDWSFVRLKIIQPFFAFIHLYQSENSFHKLHRTNIGNFREFLFDRPLLVSIIYCTLHSKAIKPRQQSWENSSYVYLTNELILKQKINSILHMFKVILEKKKSKPIVKLSTMREISCSYRKKMAD